MVILNTCKKVSKIYLFLNQLIEMYLFIDHLIEVKFLRKVKNLTSVVTITY